ncbi:hypothetical protein BP5796_04828 [Coleophoma crateriformis]|uniref:Pentacotripeptide-repeat region of PRORP domain-containing protein n=1 Tax=Coleophoma crateriformis TaxID=565419 RepID=A0A3D8SAF4_9HELO|nr:hypothetical protein BP5796_04828 [Coleophoma crateriformis]
MTTPHICAACRRSISRLRSNNTLQWQSRATFISIATPTTGENDKTKDGSKKLPQGRRAKEEQWGQARRGKRNKYPGFSPEAGAQLELLFKESVTATPSADPATSKLVPQPITPFHSYKDIDTLNQMIQDGPHVLPAAWKFFEEHYGPESIEKRPGGKAPRPTFLMHSFRRLLNNLIQAKRIDPFSTELPTVTEITRVCQGIQMLTCQDWAQLMYGLLEGLTRAAQSELPEYTHEVDEHLIKDLLGSWNIICRRTPLAPGRSLKGPYFNWSQVPRFSCEELDRAIAKHGNVYAFGYLVPRIRSRILDGVALVALASYAHLNNETRIASGVAAGADPLMAAFSRVISVVEVKESLLDSGSSPPPNLRNFVLKEWDSLKKKASATALITSPEDAASAAVTETSAETRSAFLHLRPARDDSQYMKKRVEEALRGKDFKAVEELWRRVQSWPANPEPDQSKPSHVTLPLCNYFIHAYMCLHQPHRAIDIWNFMIQKGLSPTLETWDSMLNGCRIARNWTGLEDVWGKMVSSGIQPDVVCWTTRIGGLLSCNKIEYGLEALNEMGRMWIAAGQKQYGQEKTISDLYNKKVSGAVKPSIETVNAAISVLLQRNREDLVHQTLNWAAKFGIDPDIVTYNTLLWRLFRQGRTPEAMDILKSMSEAGLKADVATFTTMLEETFRNTENKTPQEQTRLIADTFKGMEAAGVKANLHTYGKIIHQLLQGDTSDITSVNMVLERMRKERLRPSGYIYTTLVGYYFRQKPPDLDAVKQILESVRQDEGSVDNIFWDRVMEGYAETGDTPAAMKILAKKQDIGSRASWFTLRVLLLALAENQEWDVAKAMVRSIKDEHWSKHDLESGAPDAHKFWRSATEMQLLEA